MERKFRILTLALTLTLVFLSINAWAEPKEELKVTEITTQKATPEVSPQQTLTLAQPIPVHNYEDALKYTLGPDDVIQVDILRHQEFSGIFPVNLEGKIQLKFAGDIDVTGLTKKELEQKIKEITSAYVVNPQVTVTILEYKNKVIYVLGEVGQPGRYYMRSESIPVREAVVQAGLPTQAAAMRKCRIVTPDKNGKVKVKPVNLYSVLYGGDLRRNLEMRPGDVLYVPSTVMAKLVRMINPVTATVQGAAAGPTGVNTGKTAVTGLAK